MSDRQGPSHGGVPHGGARYRGGPQLWLEHPGRRRLGDGTLAPLVRTGLVTGIALGPAGLSRALSADPAAYLPQLGGLPRTVTAASAVRALLVEDARRAAALLGRTRCPDVGRPDVDRLGEGSDGAREAAVSVPLDPALAHDAGRTVVEARTLCEAVGSPRLLVRIPATAAGLTAMGDCLAEGIGVDASPVFSPDRFGQVADAMRTGLARAGAAGGDPSRIPTAVTYCTGGLDTEAAWYLERCGDRRALELRGEVAVAGARLAHESWRRSGVRPPRLVWCTGSVPASAHAIRCGLRLSAPGTAHLVSEVTAAMVPEAGGAPAADRVSGRYDEARRVLRTLEQLGIGHCALTERLEGDTLARLSASWQELTWQVAASLRSHERTRQRA
ncbi:hypothetical protein LHJ74_33265 [Streptomyces sp. N2-109]|uniref:Transaldolase n=1 Tax=Streptomyces gossypii TaxID=2883101 RepID=A0ABT2K5F4_9ACTN|nr:transaldolase family protein [Streptomyces gossypii]MCT2594729.1 hypothetical protein [Streptomyces gossypii]